MKKSGSGFGLEFWKRLDAEIRGGASRSEVARRHGVCMSALDKWRRRLAAEEPMSASLLPVRFSGPEKHRIEIALGAHRVSFDEGTSIDYVRALLASLASHAS
jgi:hypothetical protein